MTSFLSPPQTTDKTTPQFWCRPLPHAMASQDDSVNFQDVMRIRPVAMAILANTFSLKTLRSLKSMYSSVTPDLVGPDEEIVREIRRRYPIVLAHAKCLVAVHHRYGSTHCHICQEEDSCTTDHYSNHITSLDYGVAKRCPDCGEKSNIQTGSHGQATAPSIFQRFCSLL